MATVFEGTFAELQRRLPTLQLPQEKQVRLEIDTETGPDKNNQANSHLPITTESVRALIDELDDEEARNAYRIAGH